MTATVAVQVLVISAQEKAQAEECVDDIVWAHVQRNAQEQEATLDKIRRDMQRQLRSLVHGPTADELADRQTVKWNKLMVCTRHLSDNASQKMRTRRCAMLSLLYAYFVHDPVTGVQIVQATYVFQFVHALSSDFLAALSTLCCVVQAECGEMQYTHYDRQQTIHEISQLKAKIKQQSNQHDTNMRFVVAIKPC